MKMVGENQRGFVSPFTPVDFSFLAIVVSTQSNVMQSLFGHWSLEVFITESPHVRQYGFWNPENSNIFFLVESGILVFGVQNPANDWKPKSSIWNPESKNVLDYFTWRSNSTSLNGSHNWL